MATRNVAVNAGKILLFAGGKGSAHAAYFVLQSARVKNSNGRAGHAPPAATHHNRRLKPRNWK